MDLRHARQEDLRQKRLLFYARRNDKDGKRLRAAVNSVISDKTMQVYQKLDDLATRLRAPLEADSICVLLASNRKELETMLSLHGLLRDVHVVLVVPDLEEQTTELAHRLLPRFLCTKENEFNDLKKVLTKMFLFLG